MSLTNQIHVNTRYTRSINVERDRGSPSIVDAYLPTARSIDLLEDVAAALGPKDQPRAWNLVGPYGSGKSSFALFLHELLGPPGSAKKAAGRALAAERPDLARRFARQGAWCRVVLTGSEEPLATRLLAALDDAATNFWEGKPGRKPSVVEEIRRARKRRKLTDSGLLSLVDGLQAAVERNGAGGLLMVIDEMGKFLEYETRQGGGGVFLLQQLAERTFRGRKDQHSLLRPPAPGLRSLRQGNEREAEERLGEGAGALRERLVRREHRSRRYAYRRLRILQLAYGIAARVM